MYKRIILIAVAVVIVGLVGSVGVLAHRGAHTNTIADGITVGDVRVGGLDAEGAQSELRKRVLDELDDPINVKHEGQTFTLTAKEAKVAVDLDSAVQSALEKTRSGNMVQRAWREITSNDIKEDIPLKITHSKEAVKKFIERIQGNLNRKPQNASLHFSGDSVKMEPAHTGLEINARPLKARIVRSLKEPGRSRDFNATVKVVDPEVSETQLAARNPVVVTVDRKKFRLTIFKHLKKKKSFSIAVGQKGLETPAGLYHIFEKQVDPAWHVPNSDWAGDKAGTVVPGGDPDNPLKARWLGIYDGAGIHGTDNVASLGTAASHGCIRMAVKDVIRVYDMVPLHAPVFIQ